MSYKFLKMTLIRKTFDRFLFFIVFLKVECYFCASFSHFSKTAPTSWSHQAFEDTDILPSVDLLQYLQFILSQSHA